MTTQPTRNLAETSQFVMACASARLNGAGALPHPEPQIAPEVPQNVPAGICPACGGDDYKVRRGMWCLAEVQWDECADCGHKGEPC
ncbi:MAG TPA: hypothetical protein VHS96_15960 [Bacteroidia bacterium]|nr:hypothetical protein [Bacteroidia bacterium]